MKCKICQCECESDLFFCPECGKINEYPSYIKGNPNLQHALDEYVKELVSTAKTNKETIKNLVNKSDLSDTLYRKYYEHIAYLQSICQNPSVSETFDKGCESLIDKMNAFAGECKRNECQVAVVGTVKAGKSMLLNALIGQEIASSYPTPETASLTKFKYSKEGNYVRVYYYTDKEWDALWASVMDSTNTFHSRDDKEDFLSIYKALGADTLKKSYLNKEIDIFTDLTIDGLKSYVEKFTSAKHPEHFFAKEVEVGLSEINIPQNVVFVDTPGLNDPVSYRSEITKNYIASANVVLLCVNAASAELRASELFDISVLFAEMRYAKERLYIFATKYDTTDNFIEYWDQYTKPEFIKYLSGKSFFGSAELASKRIIPVSAWYYLLAQKAKQDKDVWNRGSRYLLPLANMVNKCLGVSLGNEPYATRFYNSVSEIEELTNIERIRGLLANGPLKEAEDIIAHDLKNAYSNICSEVIKTAQASLDFHNSTISRSLNSDILKQIENLDVEIPKLCKTHKKNISIVSEVLDMMHQETKSFVHNLK